MQNLNLLIKELISIPTETEWLELKYNNFYSQMIGADMLWQILQLIVVKTKHI